MTVSNVAVQLIGPDQLLLNPRKAVPTPGTHQILAQVECVGLCFSDMKLLHQFDRHPRKTPVLAHLAAEVLGEIPSYVPDGHPTVPGHEVVLRVTAIGSAVQSVRVGGRYLVQADFRDLKTNGSNGAFGYNFEGGLQQWVLLDERVTVAANGDSYLLPVPEDRAASQLALVEPWACVEDAFAVRERQTLRTGGRLLLVVSAGHAVDLSGLAIPSAVKLCTGAAIPEGFTPAKLDTPMQHNIDDLIYVGHDAEELERLMPCLAKNGLAIICSNGGRFGRTLRLPMGRVHYGNVRVIGTTTGTPAHALAAIPSSGELRPGDRVNVVGAGGPMGVMAMVRAIAASRTGAMVEGGVRNPSRATALRERIEPLAKRLGVQVRLFNSDSEPPSGPVDYCFLMAPVPELIERAMREAAPRGIINVFAGIPADVPCPVDGNLLCSHQLYFIGTSGSTMEDMRVVLGKVLAGDLDTNLSVGAVSGMAGAIAGLNAVRDRSVAGKIIVYPQLADLPLTTLDDLAQRFPSVGAQMTGGCWTAAAESELLRVAASPSA